MLTYFVTDYLHHWLSHPKGMIIAGTFNTDKSYLYCKQVFSLSTLLNYPVLTEALSILRNNAQCSPNIINTYVIILRNSQLADELLPDIVIQVGEFPTSKKLRAWLENTQVEHFVIDNRADNLDPLHNKTHYIRGHIHDLEIYCEERYLPKKPDLSYLKKWKKANRIINKNIIANFDNIK